MSKKTTAVSVKTVDPNSVQALISQAIAANLPVETMERLFALRANVKAETAKEEFVKALAKFQEECPVIVKTKSVLNKDGNTVRYKFAPIDSIVEQIRKHLATNGLSYRWEVTNEANGIKATCIITHTLGHAESSSFLIPVEQPRSDGKEYMTQPQRHASALTFAKRYSLCNALGIATGDEDDDALSAKKEVDAKDPRAKIIMRLRSLKEKVQTKEEVQEAVARLTKLDLAPHNYDEIVTRLEVVISDRHEQN